MTEKNKNLTLEEEAYALKCKQKQEWEDQKLAKKEEGLTCSNCQHRYETYVGNFYEYRPNKFKKFCLTCDEKLQTEKETKRKRKMPQRPVLSPEEKAERRSASIKKYNEKLKIPKKPKIEAIKTIPEEILNRDGVAKCTQCFEDKHLSKFSLKHNTIDKLKSRCDECCSYDHAALEIRYKKENNICVEKTCRYCKINKKEDEFDYIGNSRNLLKAFCKICDKLDRFKLHKDELKISIELQSFRDQYICLNRVCTLCKIDKPIELYKVVYRDSVVYYEECNDCTGLSFNTEIVYIIWRRTIRKILSDYLESEELNLVETPEDIAAEEKKTQQILVWRREFDEKLRRINGMKKRPPPLTLEEQYERKNAYQRKRYNEEPAYRIRNRMSSSIRAMLKNNGSNKDGESISDYLPYSISELVEHLEGLWEPWMNWDNYGNYNSVNWDDEDVSTWTWSIDHIIPHCEFKYTSMKDKSFHKCWELCNLRPYSAKLNQLDGANRNKNRKKYLSLNGH